MLMTFDQVQNWSQYPFPTRVDAFNFNEFKGALDRIGSEHKYLAMDMAGVNFINFQAIRELHSLASLLKSRGGMLAFIGASERLKRQFRLFAALEPIRWYSSIEWRREVNTELTGQA